MCSLGRSWWGWRGWSWWRGGRRWRSRWSAPPSTPSPAPPSDQKEYETEILIWGGSHQFFLLFLRPSEVESIERVLLQFHISPLESWIVAVLKLDWSPNPKMSFIAWIPFGLQEHKTYNMEHPLPSPGWDWRGLSFPSRPLLGIPRSPICLSFPREEEVSLPWPTAHLKPKPGYIRLINWVCYITIYVFYSDIYKNTYVTGMFSSDITLSHVSRFWHQYCVLPAGPNNTSWPTIMFSRTISGLLYTFNRKVSILNLLLMQSRVFKRFRC